MAVRPNWTPDSLAQIVTSLGGSVIYGAPTLQFDLPLEKAREVIPELNKLGIGCRKLRERTGDNPTRVFAPMSIATIECYRPKENELKELREEPVAAAHRNARQWR
jgi:hypothetical protein